MMVQDDIKNYSIPEHWLLWSLIDMPESLFSPLLSTESKKIKMIDPGHRNYDNGPDLLGAIIEIDNIRYKGDVEVHINQEDWFRHGHNEDQRYRSVILHILWNKQDICDDLALRFHHLILSSHLKLPLKKWRTKMLELEKNEPCQKYQNYNLDTLNSQKLERLAKKRFRKKVDRYKSWIDCHSFDDILHISLAETFGYSKNKSTFQLLFKEFPPSRIFQNIPTLQRSPLTIWIFLSLKANFLNNNIINNHFVRGQKELKFIHEIYNQFKQQGHYPVLKLNDWYFSRIRPANNPILRMAALSQILYQYQSPSLFEELLIWARNRLTPIQLLQKWQACLQLEIQSQLIAVTKKIFHINPSSPKTIGINRFRQFAINGILPIMLLWGHRTENYGFVQYIEWLYEEFPSVEDREFIKKYLPFLPDTNMKKKVKERGFYQQGFLEFINTRRNLSFKNRKQYLTT